METGAVLAVTLQDASVGDTTTIQQTLVAVAEQMEQLTAIPDNWLSELVSDEGDPSNDPMIDLKELGIRSHASEPKRGRRDWTGKPAERDAVYANRLEAHLAAVDSM